MKYPVFKILGLVLVLTCLAVVAVTLFPVTPKQNPDLLSADIPVKEETKTDYNLLICGTDQGGGRTDVILLCHLDAENKQAQIVSIPRDTYVNVKRSAKKINACNVYDGPEGLCETVKDTFGVEVDYYAIIDLNCFCDVVDRLGGVEVTVSKDMDYSDPTQNLEIHLKAGKQVLNGKQAEGFVRFRSGYAMADLTRIEAQKIFLASLIKTALSPKNLLKMPSLITAVFENMETDFDVQTILTLASGFVDVSMDDIVLFTAPGESHTYNKVSYYTLFKNETVELMNRYFSEEPITEEDISLCELSHNSKKQYDFLGTPLSSLIDKASPKK